MTGSEINTVVDHLADKLAIPAGKLMELLPAIGIRSVVMTVGGLVGVVFGVILSIWGANMDDEFSRSTLFVVGVCMVIFFAIMFMVSLSDMIIWLYNPQAWALRYLLGFLVGGE